jgi:hypothetical protein
MIRERTLRKRQKLVETLPITGELLRGTLLERVVLTRAAVQNARAAKAIMCTY